MGEGGKYERGKANAGMKRSHLLKRNIQNFLKMRTLQKPYWNAVADHTCNNNLRHSTLQVSLRFIGIKKKEKLSEDLIGRVLYIGLNGGFFVQSCSHANHVGGSSSDAAALQTTAWRVSSREIVSISHSAASISTATAKYLYSRSFLLSVKIRLCKTV
ncbi:hypothetical protein CHUAL_009940 [Chamberlinius hualienensis]